MLNLWINLLNADFLRTACALINYFRVTVCRVVLIDTLVKFLVLDELTRFSGKFICTSSRKIYRFYTQFLLVLYLALIYFFFLILVVCFWIKAPFSLRFSDYTITIWASLIEILLGRRRKETIQRTFIHIFYKTW